MLLKPHETDIGLQVLHTWREKVNIYLTKIFNTLSDLSDTFSQ